MILMQAPAGGMTFAGMPSGTTYVSNQYSMIAVTNSSTADQAALQRAGCFTLTPFGGWGTFSYNLLADLYAADNATNLVLPGTVGFPANTTCQVLNDTTLSNNGTWYKTGTGNGTGNWSFTSALATSGAVGAAASATAAITAAASASAGATTATSNANAATTAANTATAAANLALTAGSVGNPYPTAAATYIPQGVAAFSLTSGGAGGTNAPNVLATYTGGTLAFNPVIYFDIVAGIVTNVRMTFKGLFIGTGTPTMPTVTFPGAAGSPAITLTAGAIVPVGATYWAQSADASQILLYSNSAGSPAQYPTGPLQTSLPSFAYIAALGFDVSAQRYLYGKQVFAALMEVNYRNGWSVTADGYFYSKPAIKIGLAANGLSWTQDTAGFWNISLGSIQNQLPLGTAGDVIDSTSVWYYQKKQVLNADADSMSRASIITAIDGSVYIPKLQLPAATAIAQATDTANYIYTTAQISSKTQIVQTTKATGATLQITTLGNNQNMSLSYNGTNLVYASDRSGTSVSYFQPIPSTGQEYPVISRTDFVLLGDSRTVVYWPTFAALYPGRLTDNEGVGGQDSYSIAARFGAIATTLTVSGNSVPASGSVTVSTIRPNVFYNWNYSTGAIHGSIAGVAGVLTFSSGALSFTRDASGSAVAVAATVAFVPDGATVQNSTSVAGATTLAALQGNTAIIAPGYNDLALAYVYSYQTYNQAATLTNFAAIIAALKPFVPRFIVLGVYMGEGILTAGSGGIGAGQSTYGLAPNVAASASMFNGITSLNAALAAAYPNNYVDVQAAFVAAGFGESATINGVPGCTIINSTALTDGVHPYTPVGANVQAAAIKSFLTAKGW